MITSMEATNLVFGVGQNSSIIDFDMANKEGTFYCRYYNRDLPERHPDIQRVNNPTMSKVHDRFSIAYIIECFDTTKSCVEIIKAIRHSDERLSDSVKRITC